MNNNLYSVFLTSLAGISTTLGYFVIYFRGNKNKIIMYSLSLASGVMICISLIDLIPSSFNYLNHFFIIFKILIISLFIVFGFFLSSFFDKHVNINDSLYRIGIISIVGIILHNIPEGIITFMVSNVNHDLGLKLALAIAIHNIPEGISIAIPIFYSTKNKFKTFLLTFISGISELLGGLVCLIFFKNGISDLLLGIIFAIISGIMINIGISLFMESRRYSSKSFLGFIIGFIIMIISLII